MPYRFKNKVTNTSILISLAVGFALAWLITIAAGMIITFLVAGERISEESIAPAAVMAMFAASFVSSITVGKMQREKHFLMCLINGGIYYLSLLCCNALIFDGQYQGLLGAVLTITGSSIIAAFLQTRQKKQRPSYLKSVRKARDVHLAQ